MQSQRQRSFRSIVATSVVVLAVIPPVYAQSAEAEQLFSDGMALIKQGKLAQACAAFAASNRIEPRAGTLIQLGDCLERNRQLASAWSAYKDAVGRAKDPRKRAYAAGKVAALEPRLSYVTVQVIDDNRSDGLVITRDGKSFDAALWNRALPLDGGSYRIAARAPGRIDWETTVQVPFDNGKLTVAVPKLKELPVAVRPPPPPEPRESRESRGSQEPRESPESPASSVVVAAPGAPPALTGTVESPSSGMFTGTRKLAVGLASVSVASLAAGIALGVTANGKKNDAFALCPDARSCEDADDANDQLSSSHTWATAANVAYGLSVVSVGVAAVLWFTGGPSREQPRGISVRPSVTPSAVGIVGSIGW